jgi:hypothetical protein
MPDKRFELFNPTHHFSDDPDASAAAQTMLFEVPSVGGKLVIEVAAVAASVLTGGTGAFTLQLKGEKARKFVPSRLVATGLTVGTGDAEVSVGTTVSGVDILAATALTGVTAAGKSLPLAPASGVMPAIAGDAVLYGTVTSADTTATARVMITVEGTLVG